MRPIYFAARRLLTLLVCMGGIGACVTGCTTSRVRGATYRFPDAFSAQQRIEIDLGKTRQNFVATVKRDSQGLTVVLLEPFFQMPMVELTRSADGPVKETWHVPKPEGAHHASKLIGMLDELFEKLEWQRTAAASTPKGLATVTTAAPTEWRAEGTFYDAEIAGVPSSGACRFPKLLLVRPSRGPVKLIRAATEAVTCPETLP